MQRHSCPLFILTERYGMEEDYTLNRVYFDELIEKFGKALTGKIMKRFELSSDLPDIKIQTKNLIYEECRALKQLLDAHAMGRQQVIWKFTTKKGMED